MTELLDIVLSAEEVGIYKPHSRFINCLSIAWKSLHRHGVPVFQSLGRLFLHPPHDHTSALPPVMRLKRLE